MSDVESTRPISTGDATTIILSIVNEQGLHARPAAEIVKITNKYNDCEVVFKNEDVEVNGKSLMGLLMLAAGKGSQLTIVATGSESQSLIDEISDFVKGGFGELVPDP